MNTLAENVADYLAMRRTMGFKVEGLGKLLNSFVRFCQARGLDHVRADIAVQWATTRLNVPVIDALVALRMDAVRIFAKHQHALDPATQIPPENICTRRYQPREPNVFSQTQVSELLAAANTLTPRFRALTWRNLIGLLAVTGMRPGEACRLSLSDIDLANGVVQILQTKFNKSRQVFLHPTVSHELGHYLHVRSAWIKADISQCPMLFLNTRRAAIDASKLAKTFTQIATTAGIATVPGHRPPRLHDLRHTFAVRTLLEWYRDGVDVQARLPLLSTWLGHVDPASTYWYLHAVPELLTYAARRLEDSHGANLTEAES